MREKLAHMSKKIARPMGSMSVRKGMWTLQIVCKQTWVNLSSIAGKR